MVLTPAQEPPVECRIRCDDPPPLVKPREVWEAEVLIWGLQCRELHNVGCVEGLKAQKSGK